GAWGREGLPSALPTENHVLRASGEAGEPALERPQRGQHTWKEEEEIGPQHVKSRAGEQLTSALRRQQLRVAIEPNAPHDEPGARIPRVVLPEAEVSAL